MAFQVRRVSRALLDLKDQSDLKALKVTMANLDFLVFKACAAHQAPLDSQERTELLEKEYVL